MKLTLDTDARTLTREDGAERETLDLYSDRAFELLSHHWVNVGWVQKHCYSFSWLGRPIIQLPDDMIRIQELIHTVQPTLIIETGIAHGGSLIYYASVAKAADLPTRILGVDIEIRPHNRSAIESHALYDRIEMIEGSSIAEDTLARIDARVRPDDTVMVILDSNHSYDHVLAELRAYARWVSMGSYFVSTDGVMRQVAGLPRTEAAWARDNPVNANEDFVAETDAFEIVEPDWPFNESTLDFRVTHWPKCYLKRVR